MKCLAECRASMRVLTKRQSLYVVTQLVAATAGWGLGKMYKEF